MEPKHGSAVDVGVLVRNLSSLPSSGDKMTKWHLKIKQDLQAKRSALLKVPNIRPLLLFYLPTSGDLCNPVYVSVCVCVWVCLSSCVSLCVSLSVCVSVCLSVSVCLFVCNVSDLTGSFSCLSVCLYAVTTWWSKVYSKLHCKSRWKCGYQV